LSFNRFAFRIAIIVLVPVLLFLSQRFWIRSLWDWSRGFRRSLWRNLLRGAVIAVLVFYILSLADRLAGLGWMPRNGPFRVFLSMLQLWIFASMLGYLFFKVVRALELTWFGAKDLVLRKKAVEPENQDRRSFFRLVARVAAAVPLVAAVYGYSSERFRYEVRRVDVPIAGLAPELDGFQIVQISDIHIGDFMPRDEVRRAVDIANGLGAQVAVVTGDLITGHADPLVACVEEIARLRAPLGVWGCNGNHEIYAEAEDAAQALYTKHGMKLLRQERTELEWRGAKLNLIGVDYQRDSMVRGPKPPMLAGVEPLVRRDMPNVLLSHNPNSFYKAAELGIELSLAGHTHGGQVDVEILDRHLNPSRFVTKFVAGLFHLPIGNGAFNGTEQNGKSAYLYVNSGIGMIALPARFGVDPEITLLTLRRG